MDNDKLLMLQIFISFVSMAKFDVQIIELSLFSNASMNNLWSIKLLSTRIALNSAEVP